MAEPLAGDDIERIFGGQDGGSDGPFDVAFLAVHKKFCDGLIVEPGFFRLERKRQPAGALKNIFIGTGGFYNYFIKRQGTFFLRETKNFNGDKTFLVFRVAEDITIKLLMGFWRLRFACNLPVMRVFDAKTGFFQRLELGRNHRRGRDSLAAQTAGQKKKKRKFLSHASYCKNLLERYQRESVFFCLVRDRHLSYNGSISSF